MTNTTTTMTNIEPQEREVFAKMNQLFSDNEERWMEPGFVAEELRKAFGFTPEQAKTLHWDWAARNGNVNALNHEEDLELAQLATEEAMAAGTFFTICQSCCWPILNT